MKKLILIFTFCFFTSLAYAQITDAEITSIVNIKELTLSGLLMLACYFFYKDSQTNKADLKAMREEKDKQIQDLNDKIYIYSVKQSEMFSDFKQVVQENTKTIENYGRLLEKSMDRNQR